MVPAIYSFVPLLLLVLLGIVSFSQIPQCSAQTAPGPSSEALNDQADDVAICDTVEALQQAVNVDRKPHVVVTQHLDMAGARPVSPGSLAVLSLSPATQHIWGICNMSAPALNHPDALQQDSMFCVIDVLHTWLQVEPGSGPIETVISNLFVRSARDGRDGRSPCMLNFNGAAESSRVWLQGLALQGDDAQGRGVCSPSCDISSTGCHFSGFSAQTGAAIFMDADRLQTTPPALSLENCTITGNSVTMSPESGAAIFSSGVPVRLNGTTLSNNGAREIAVRGAATFTVGSSDEQKLIYDPSDETLEPSIPWIPAGDTVALAGWAPAPQADAPAADAPGLEVVVSQPEFPSSHDDVARLITQSGEAAMAAAITSGATAPRGVAEDTVPDDAFAESEAITLMHDTCALWLLAACGAINTVVLAAIGL